MKRIAFISIIKIIKYVVRFSSTANFTNILTEYTHRKGRLHRSFGIIQEYRQFEQDIDRFLRQHMDYGVINSKGHKHNPSPYYTVFQKPLKII